jgi:protein arginine phosphatase
MDLEWYAKNTGLKGKRIKHVLFVCMGNTCRSPACEFEFKQLTHWWESLRSASRGTLQAAEDLPMAEEMQKAIGDKLASFLTSHRAHMISSGDVDGSDLVLAVDLSTRDRLRAMFPAAAKKIFTLKEFTHEAKADPNIANPWLPPEKRPKPGTVAYHNYMQGYAKTIESIRIEVRKLVDILYQLNAAAKS